MKQFFALALLAVAAAADTVKFVNSPVGDVSMQPLFVSPEMMQKVARIAEQVYQALEVKTDEIAPVASADSVVVVNSVSGDVKADTLVEAVKFVDSPVSDVEERDAVVFVESAQEVEEKVAARDTVIFVDTVEAAEEAVEAVKFVDAPVEVDAEEQHSADASEVEKVLIVPGPAQFGRYPPKQFKDPYLRGAQ